MEILNILKNGLNILTPQEYIIAAVAMILSTIITEFIKRNVVWKKEGRKQGHIQTHFWGGTINIPKIAIIGLLISYLFTFIGYLFYGSNTGKLILVPVTVGITTPIVYKLSISFCRKRGWHELANFISGDRREVIREG